MSSTLQAIRVLEELARLQPIGLSDLARKMGLPKSTVQRCVDTLLAAGWIEVESPVTKRWCVSMRPFAIAVTAIQRGGLRDRALPVMNRLSEKTDETIHLAVRDEREVVLVERVDSPHALRAVSPVGSRGLLHASSNGKAILAALPEADLRAYLDSELEPATSRTVTEPTALLEEIRSVRRIGYAVSREEHQTGVVSVAAAVRNASGQVVGALSISAPRERMFAERLRELGPLVDSAAEEIGSQLGYRP